MLLYTNTALSMRLLTSSNDLPSQSKSHPFFKAEKTHEIRKTIGIGL